MFRNLITTLLRFSTSSTLNILGLTVAYVAFIIISLQVITEYSYDKMYPDADRIYRVERPSWRDKGRWATTLSRPIIDVITNSSSEIEESCFVGYGYQDATGTIWRLEGGSNDDNVVENVPIGISKEFVDMFGMNIVEGVLSDDPSGAIIPKSMADKLFGNESAIGKILINCEGGMKPVPISGVYEDFPAISSFQNKMFNYVADEDVGKYNYSNFSLFVKLHKNADIAAVEHTFNKVVRDAETAANRKVGDNTVVRLHKFSDNHFSTDMEIRGVEYVNMQKIQLFTLFALLIILIASINYINFSTALIPLRIRDINTRKIFGATIASLRTHLIFEAIGISVIAYIAAAAVVCSFGNLSKISFISTQIDVVDYLPTIALIGLFAVVLGALAGIYPAFYSTSFKTAYVLKGSFSLSPKGKALRSVLVGFQFVISIGLIIVSMFMNLQFSMIQKQDLGIEKENIVRINVNGDVSKKTEEVKKALSGIAGVTEVTNTPQSVLSSSYSEYTFKDEGGEGEKKLYCIHGPSNIVDFFGLKVVEGVNFTAADDMKCANSTILINQIAQKKYNLKIGDRLNNRSSISGYTLPDDENTPWEIIGVIEDFNFKPLYEHIEPLMIINYGTSSNYHFNTIYAKVVTDDYSALIKSITSSIKDIDSNWVPDIAFLDSMIEELYQSDLRSASLVSWFSLLAILISLAGVFGLVHFEVGYRRKEIGLRKINGATIPQIIKMLSSKFLIITIISYVVATPLAIYLVNDWLSVFAYRTPLYLWVFAAAMAIILFITLTTVFIQSYRAATDNPVKSLKSE